MPYDAKLDNQIFTQFWENDLGKISVSIYSYNNGPKKIQISRENYAADGEPRFAKLGRLLKEELEAIMPHLQEALGQL